MICFIKPIRLKIAFYRVGRFVSRGTPYRVGRFVSLKDVQESL